MFADRCIAQPRSAYLPAQNLMLQRFRSISLKPMYIIIRSGIVLVASSMSKRAQSRLTL